MVGGVVSDGSNVTLNGHPYLVQELWSNADIACVLGWTSELQVDTGNPPDPGLSSGSAVAAALYKPIGTLVPPTVLLKSAWG
jgi:hypothetical protein